MIEMPMREALASLNQTRIEIGLWLEVHWNSIIPSDMPPHGLLAVAGDEAKTAARPMRRQGFLTPNITVTVGGVLRNLGMSQSSLQRPLLGMGFQPRRVFGLL
ncbi:uncharacterized protein GLRG_03040 [Colletotrichum graminicola M1.001]|uniref:Uncharacterized protein n=1 Tax=Colletotrichum graminicola (strain M1.001 / M2 / FGSC 10212) TaxID=645133 RepID=E3QAK8_COLGM|nr:uncharacterized protein GLRG_03040 [Colletotrichum graminicola M1.001]EFQ27896.1 hypothetical protein GLRG_03040 [Colletotrichum graminicola M1.001]